MTTYPVLRTVHLLCGVFAVPALLMYGVSAVQMSHSAWFRMKPVVTESVSSAGIGMVDGRQVTEETMAKQGFRGEIESVKETPAGFAVRVVVPGTVREIAYERTSGLVRVRTSVSGVMGMLNRLHHAAGVRREYLPLRLWGALMAVVALAIIGLGVTGIWMWWLRKQERTWGLILLGANLAYGVTLLWLIRAGGV
ncbi:MAG: PepSY domain-containing protein [Bryobacteraceae bacterium]